MTDIFILYLMMHDRRKEMEDFRTLSMRGETRLDPSSFHGRDVERGGMPFLLLPMFMQGQPGVPWTDARKPSMETLQVRVSMLGWVRGTVLNT